MSHEVLRNKLDTADIARHRALRQTDGKLSPEGNFSVFNTDRSDWSVKVGHNARPYLLLCANVESEVATK
jgi:hypothetical protein